MMAAATSMMSGSRLLLLSSSSSSSSFFFSFSSSTLRRLFSSPPPSPSSSSSPLALSRSLYTRRRSLLSPVLHFPSRRCRCCRRRPRPRCCCCFCSEATPQCQSQAEEAPPPSDPVREAAEALDIRVGRVLRAWRHPEADSLYVEEVDVGEAEPRTICSGLVDYIPLDHLQDCKVVVLANLKPRNMRGIKSNGMLMAASDESHKTVELLIPPEGSITGERIWFGSEEEKDRQPDAATPNQVQKKKIWESVQPHLRTTDSCAAVLLAGTAHPMQTSAGTVTCNSLRNARIS
ncbi:aminoacyl tRNA synthase complex-interacting multifunctional protein 1-like isoform X1 [Ananas comosus]|uniref:Aminoacyl tRNA synthase complex-interacting multifunctional protein 1-like isoform X1 n=1 Tax=Ananas comosus TaxID=4615 RepID=A0A6P5EY47_ANACO|nr:aminoacyl tRNA synthase complex-interacting multifunctional protein 1-like isoform X1 [Ananas comosus]